VPTYCLKSFGKLLKRLRGKHSLSQIAERSDLDADYLANVETGRPLIDVALARTILERGFELDPLDVTRLILGVQLYDLGLTDNDFRQLTIDLMLKLTPKEVRSEVRRLYRSYSSNDM